MLANESGGARISGAMFRRSGWLVAAALVVGAAGCSEESQRVFRGAASAGLQQGVSALLNGVVDGAFAVFDRGTDSEGSGGSSGESSSSTSP